MIDYRSDLYQAPPDRLSRELGREPLAQRRFGGNSGVLIVAVEGPADDQAARR